MNGLFLNVLGHPRRFNLLLELVEFALFAAAKLFVNGLELLIQVVLFLRAFHLPLDARIDVAVDVEFFDLAFQDFRHAVQTILDVEIFEQLLLFLHRNLEIGGDRIGEFGGVFDACRGNHGVVVQTLGELHVLLKEAVDATNGLIDLRRRLDTHR